MAEDGLGCPFRLVGDTLWFPLVAADAVLFAGNAEGLDAGMAGSAGFSLFHIGHGEMAAVLQIENGVVTDLAVVVVFGQVELVAEDDRLCVFKLEDDLFGFLRVRREGGQEPHHYNEQGKT